MIDLDDMSDWEYVRHEVKALRIDPSVMPGNFSHYINHTVDQVLEILDRINTKETS